METIFVGRIRDIIKNRSELEKKLGVRISIQKNNVSIDGDAIKEYEAEIFFNAYNFGFSVKKAILLKNEDYIFRVVKIKDHTRRNLSVVKGRLIGKKGKTKRVFADTSNCEIIIGESEVGIIGEIGDVESAETAVINLIKGSKETNMYRFLEKQNKIKKESTSFVDPIRIEKVKSKKV